MSFISGEGGYWMLKKWCCKNDINMSDILYTGASLFQAGP